MSIIGLLSIIIPLLVIFLVAVFIVAKKRKPLNRQYFVGRWQNVQKMCASKATWPLAIIDADKLLDEALKKANYKGKTAGERLVSAQRSLSDNDGIWSAHKMRNRIVHEHDIELREKDIKTALINFRQALKDLGAL